MLEIFKECFLALNHVAPFLITSFIVSKRFSILESEINKFVLLGLVFLNSWKVISIWGTKVVQELTTVGSKNWPLWYTTSHPATRRRSDVITTYLCTSQQRRRYVSNDTPNDVFVERRQDVSVVHLHDILLEHRDDA